VSLPLGASPGPDGTLFAVRARDAAKVDLCLFEDGRESRVEMARQDDIHVATIVGAKPGLRYGFRAEGPWTPEQGHFFDAAKLLLDPYAKQIDQRFQYHSALAARGIDTALLVPKAMICTPLAPLTPKSPVFAAGGLIYELNVRGFTLNHPDVPPRLRGTIAALAHPAIIAHFHKLHVDAIELMPVVAWIDERHLPPLGLRNAWGYNPVVPMAIDPGLAPGGIGELRETVFTLRKAGIGVILDLVLNHTGESDLQGPTLSLRGLDSRYYVRAPDGTLINDTGTGNTLNAAEPMVRTLILDTLRHFVSSCGVDGFRFDLTPVLARAPSFDRQAPIFAEIEQDPLLKDRVLIAEPWDIGPGGYRLGQFPANWLEWNDRYRDDLRRFWRGDGHTAGILATRLAGSSDIFAGATTRSVNFIAAHDGFTLADLVAYRAKHNDANGEGNRDGQNENFSWNNGVEGPTDDALVIRRRNADVRALLATLFASRGTVMIAAGDELGRTQQGNNNAYAQDNAITWVDWGNRDFALEDFVAKLATSRGACPELKRLEFLKNATWHDLNGAVLTAEKWESNNMPGFEVRIYGTCSAATIIRIDWDSKQCIFGCVMPDKNIEAGYRDTGPRVFIPGRADP
jgi:glycogen debranching enzyme